MFSWRQLILRTQNNRGGNGESRIESAVEISAGKRGFGLEFWEKSDEEDAAPVREQTVDSGERAIQEAMQWLG